MWTCPALLSTLSDSIRRAQVRRSYDTTVDVMRGELRRKLAALFCSISVALSVFCGIALSIGPHHANLEARALENGWNIICSAAGLIVVDAYGNRVPDDQTGQVGSGAQCVFCLPLMHGDVALAAPTVISAPEQVLQLRRLPPPITRVQPRIQFSKAWPRAPPPVSIDLVDAFFGSATAAALRLGLPDLMIRAS